MGSTAENLAAAIEGESYERDTMYPEFLATARSERNADALETFNYAKSAEAEHASSTSRPRQSRSMRGEGTTYYVCSVCGFTTTNLDFTKCLSCFSPKEKYEPWPESAAGARSTAARSSTQESMIDLPPLPTWDGIHPLVVHFPIALLLVAPLLVLLAAALAPARGRGLSGRRCC